jgi:TRAP-type C4-dicarboxylate transport system permease small subunit
MGNGILFTALGLELANFLRFISIVAFLLLENLLFYFAYNQVAPTFNSFDYFTIPSHLSYWFLFWFTIVMFFIGKLIKLLIPRKD